MEIPSSKHMVDLAYRWPMEKAIETSIATPTPDPSPQGGGEEVVPTTPASKSCSCPSTFRGKLNCALERLARVGAEGHALFSPRAATATAGRALWRWRSGRRFEAVSILRDA